MHDMDCLQCMFFLLQILIWSQYSNLIIPISIFLWTLSASVKNVFVLICGFFFLWKRFHSIPIFLKTLHVHMYVVVSNFIEPMQNTFLFDKNIGNTVKSAAIVREDILARNAAIARFNSTYFSNVNLVLVQLTFL